jgi:hypothetical protein
VLAPAGTAPAPAWRAAPCANKDSQSLKTLRRGDVWLQAGLHAPAARGTAASLFRAVLRQCDTRGQATPQWRKKHSCRLPPAIAVLQLCCLVTLRRLHCACTSQETQQRHQSQSFFLFSICFSGGRGGSSKLSECSIEPTACMSLHQIGRCLRKSYRQSRNRTALKHFCGGCDVTSPSGPTFWLDRVLYWTVK